MRIRALVVGTALLAAAGGASAAEFGYGGGVVWGSPTGSFGRVVDDAWGLEATGLVKGRQSVLGLRLELEALVYGRETVRTTASRSLNRIEVEQETSNWIGRMTVGPQLMARAGRVRPYAFGQAGIGYFATTTEARGRDDFFSFARSTNFDDATFTYGGGGGVLVLLGGGQVALDLGARFTRHDTVDYLVEGDIRDVPGGIEFVPRRSRASLWEVRVGLSVPR